MARPPTRAGPTTRPPVEDPRLAEGLVGAWRMDEQAGSTRVTDSSGHGNHGVLVDVDPATAWTGGPVQGALHLGTGGWVKIEPSPSLDSISAAVTVAAWVNKPASNGDQFYAVVTRQYLSGGREHYGLFLAQDGRVRFEVFNDGPIYPGCESPAPVAPGEWRHLAGTFDGAVLRLYIDGLERCTHQLARAIPPGATPLLLGANSNDASGIPGRRLGGQLDEVLLYRRALPADEVKRLAAGSRPPAR
jgi:hypothetical protein